MALTIEEIEALRRHQERATEQDRPQALPQQPGRLKKPTEEQAEIVRQAIRRNRPVYNALRDS